jgi:hypothetical protein
MARDANRFGLVIAPRSIIERIKSSPFTAKLQLQGHCIFKSISAFAELSI